MVLNIAFNYGGRDEIVTATKKIAQQVLNNEISIKDINEEMFAKIYIQQINQTQICL